MKDERRNEESKFKTKDEQDKFFKELEKKKHPLKIWISKHLA